MATSAVLDLYRRQETEQRGYPFTLYKPELAAETESPKLLDILDEVLQCNDLSTLPKALRQKITGLGLGGGSDAGSDLFGEESNWTLVDLPRQHHTFSSVLQTEEEKDFSNGRLCSTDGWMASEEEYDDEHDSQAWYQLDAGCVRTIGGVEIKPHSDDYIVSFICKVSEDETTWEHVDELATFDGPTDFDERASVYFQKPVIGRYLRIYITEVYDMYPAGHFGLYIEVSDAAVMDGLKLWCQSGGIYAAERLTAFLDKTCEKTAAQTAQVLGAHHRQFKRNVEATLEEVADAQGVPWTRVLQLIINDQKHDKSLPECDLWPLLAAVRDVQVFEHLLVAQREKLRAFRLNAMNTAGKTLPRTPGLPDMADMHAVSDVPTTPYDRQRQRQQEQGTAAFDSKIASLNASLENGTLKKAEHSFLVGRAEKLEMALGWMMQDDTVPIWAHSVYTAEFLSSNFDQDVRSDEGMQAFTRLLRDVILEQQVWLGSTKEEFVAFQYLLKTCANAVPLFQRFSKYCRWSFSTHLELLVSDIGDQLSKLMPGQTAMFPVTLQPFILIVECTEAGTCRVTVVNTNPECGYHPQMADRPARIRQHTCVTFDNVSLELIQDKTWWLFAVPVNLDDADHGDATKLFYTHILNYLTPGRTYESMIVETFEEQEIRTPCQGGGMLWKALHHAAGYILRRQSVRKPVRKLLKFNMRLQMLQWVIQDMNVISSLPSGHSRLIRLGCEQVAAAATKAPGVRLSKGYLKCVLDCMDQIQEEIKRKSPDEHGDAPPLLELDAGHDKNVQSDLLPGMEYLRRDDDVEHLTGERVPEANFLPPNFLSVPDAVRDLDTALAAIRNADTLCTRVMVQRDMIRSGSNLLIVALLQHLFVWVLPFPRFAHKDCLWQRPLRYAQQLELLVVLGRVMEHWAAACLSLLATAEFDGVRITIAGCIAAIADCAIRQKAIDEPSKLCQHIAGYRSHAAFGFTTGEYAKQSETIKVTSPELLIARTAVLDYFECLHETVPQENKIFLWEAGLDRQAGAANLFFKLAIHEAFPLRSSYQYLYNTEADPMYLMLKNFPELGPYRDIAFYFKYLMNTIPGGFPTGQFTQFQAQLKWEFDDQTDKYVVKAFGLHLLPMAKKDRHRWPSYATASRFTHPIPALTEDDVLHIKSLPSFGDVVGQRDSELLLSYLTTPYIRIPLVLQFFATEDRVSLLRAPSMQQVLDSVLFEPGRYQKIMHSDIAPKMVPSEDEGLLATPYGLLINELQHSPSAVVTPLLRLLTLATELDSGTVFNDSAVKVMLYLVRMTSRVYNYLWFLVAFSARNGTFHAGWDDQELRGVTPLAKPCLSELKGFQREFLKAINERLCPMLETWTEEAMCRALGKTPSGLTAVCGSNIDEMTRLVSTLQAHIVLLRRNAPMNVNVSSSLLSSIVFLTLRHTWNSTALVVPETEIYEVMQLQRRRMANLLCGGGPIVLSEVLDGVVRVATSTGSRKARPEDPTYNWAFVAGYASAGRFTYESLTPRKLALAPGPKAEVVAEALGEWISNKAKESVEVASLKNRHFGLYFSAEWCPPCKAFTPILQRFYDNYRKTHPEFEIVFCSNDRTEDDYNYYYEHEHGDWLTIPFADSDRRRRLGNVFDVNSLPAFVIVGPDGKVCNMHGRDRVSRGLQKVLDVGWEPDPLPDLISEVKAEAARSGIKSLHPSVSFCQEFDRTVEVSVMTFDFTFKSGHLRALPTNARSIDIVAVFDAGTSLQCATVENSQHRDWYRLVGRDHDIQVWTTLDERVVLPQCDREYPEELEEGERWIQPLLDPIKRRYVSWADHLYYLPTRPMGDDEVATFIEVVDFFTGVKQFEIYAFKHLNCLQIYSIYSYGRRHYRSLVYCTDARYSLRFLQPDAPETRKTAKPENFRFEAGNLDTKLGGRAAVILRHVACKQNRAGCVEQFIPARLLWGLIPDCLLEEHLFWQDSQDCLRGYPKDAMPKDGAPKTAASKDSSRHLLFVQLRDVNFQSLRESFTTARIIRYAAASSCPKTRERKKLKPEKEHEDLPEVEEIEMIRTSTFASDGMARGASDDFARQSSSLSNDDGKPALPKPAMQAEDQDLLLLNLLHAREGSPLRSLAKLLTRMDDLSHVLVWTNNLNLKDGEPIDLTWVHLPRLKLSFKGRATAEGTQLVSLDHAHLYVSNLRGELTVHLIQGAPHSLFLQDKNGEMSVLIPAFRLARPDICDNPFTTELVIDRCDEDWLKLSDTRYFLYPIHVSLSFLQTPTLASSLYLLLIRLLARLYDDSFRLAGTVGTDTALTDQESLIFDSIGEISDLHPAAHACRCRLTLQTVDSPLDVSWYAPDEAFQYLVKRSKIAATCRLSQKEEALLMWIVDITDKKMAIVREYAKRDKKPWEVLAREDYPENIDANERRLVKGFVQSLQKAFRDELNLRLPFKDVVRECEMCQQNDTELTPFTRCLLQNHIRYVTAETAGEKQAVVEVPDLGGDDYVDFDAHYDHLKEAKPVRLTNHVFQRQIRVHEILSRVVTLTREKHKSDIAGSTRPATTFLFFIELLTGETVIKLRKHVLDGKCAVYMMLPWCYYSTDLKDRKWDTQRYMIAMLQALKHDPMLIERVPLWAPDRKDREIRGCRNWNDSVVAFASFMRDLQAKLNELHGQGALVTPTDPKSQKKVPRPPPSIDIVVRLRERSSRAQPLLDTLCLPALADSACSSRRLLPASLDELLAVREDPAWKASVARVIAGPHLKSFSDMPLSVLPGLLNSVEHHTRRQRDLPEVSADMPFDVESHPASRSQVAQLMLARLHDDVKSYAEKANSEQTCILKGLSGAGDLVHVVNTPQLVPDIIERLTALSVEIKGLQKADNEFLQLAIPALIEMGNKVPDAADDGAALAFRLRRYSRLEVAMWLEYILGSLISSDMKGDLLKLNPFLADVEVERMSQLITVMLLATSRVGLANKACDELHGILELLHSIQSNKPDSHSSVHLQEEKFLARLAALSQKNGAVARMLTVQRSYLQPENSPGSVPSYLFDPRFMLFEFTWNIVLRQSQVTMVNNFVASLREGRSHVKQMIMGAGKTTVVGPLVVLMSADGSTLLMQVVPPSLLDFSRGVLRSTFASLIPKAIYTFVCDRTSEIDVLVVNKFQRAVSSRGVVVTTPSSLKSIFLKFVEGIERMADESRLPPPPELEAETRDLKKLLILWKDKAVVVMDEVDLLLHPLKSELNFPIGEKHDLPLLSLRWRLPIHLFDAIYFHNLGRMSVSFKDSSKAKVILSELQQVLKGGFESRALQDTPHVILLNLGYFSTKVKPIMAKWLQLWLESLHVTSLSEEHTVAYLSSPEKRAAMKEHVEATVPKYDIMLLNLGHDWLHAFLPHCLQKIDRVSFGIMTPFDIDRALQENPQMPRSRIKLAIPFIGKDLPSQSSEFAHPDVVIGLTILAYRYEGLRESDFTEVLKLVLTSVEKEVGKFSQRKTNKMYDRWIEAANGRVTQVYNYDRGTGKGLSEELAEAGRQRTVEFVDLATKEVLSLSAYAAVLAIVADALFVEVAPLRKLKQSNREEFEKLYKLLRLTPEVIHWFLEEIVFPEYMRHQTLKLSASGQELGSDVIFKSRIGFSGTPSDLLPEELGRCDYEKCTDGQLIHTLTSAHTVSYHLLEKGWTVQSVLEAIASQQPPFHALIDTGALITGLSNLEVAQYLMSKDRMPQMEGCIFLDELDRKMILVRATNRVIKLEECGIPKLKRFTFYDQVHTTGLDVSHAPNAQAALTLGKDMTFRDFAQGAYRMRGIGTGQTVDLIIIPEVYDLMSRELVLAGMHSMPKNPPADSGMCADEAVTRNVLVSTVAWLMVNSMRTEKLQYNQLCVQKISAVYRKEAFQDLLNRDGEFTLRPGVRPTKRARDALNIYRQPVEFSIPDFVPQDRLFADVLRGLVESEDPPNKSFVPKEGWAVVDRILNEVHKEKQRHQENHDVQMVQEQEEEKEDEEEKEEEKEIEVEKYIDLVYSRDSEEPVAWEVGALASLGAAKQFYAMEDFRMYRKRNIAFPESLMASRNFFDLRWGGERRIKNVVCLLEWVPAAAALAIKDKPSRDFGAVCAPPLSGILKFFGDEKSCDLSTTVDILKIALGTAPKRAEIKKTLFADKSALTPSDLQSVLESNILRNEEDGRRYVAVSLREAETLRRILHVKTRLNEPFLQSNPDTHVAIRCVPAGGVVLDRTQGFPAEPHSVTYHADKALASFRYFDGEVSYTDADLNLLLRSLHCSPPAQRLVFFQQVVGCRRRGTVARSENTPLAKVCRLIDAYALLYQRSLGSCMHREIEARDLSLGEAFTAMNSSGSGVILPAELWGGLRWLGIECSSQQVLDFIATADSVNEGNLAYPDFLAITTGKQDEEDVPDDNEGKHLPVVEKYGEELLRAEAIAMRNKALQVRLLPPPRFGSRTLLLFTFFYFCIGSRAC
ncbi:putative nucleoredoxin 1-2 [Diplonema papillatum]|nr:putative nucleoredoxin 1-2 [Diplonema papillatum]